MQYQIWLEDWLSSCIKPFMKDRTIVKYVGNVHSKLIPKLGEYEMEDLTAPILQKFVAELTEKYSASTVEGVITVLRGSLQSAVKMGVLDRQYTDCIEGPEIEEKPVECFNRIEQKKIENFVLESKKTKLIGILITLYTGIRIGELFALTWNDLDLKKETMIINKSCHDGWGGNGYHKIIERPKTKASKRTIPLPKQIIPHIRRLRKESMGEYVIYGNGKDISVRSYQRTFELLLIKLEIEHKGFHALRHTFATRAIECGMDVKSLSEILGHKNPMITLIRYAHSLLEHKSAMMNKVGKLLQ